MKLADGSLEWAPKFLKDLATINYGRSPAAILSPDGPYPVLGTGDSDRSGTDYLYNGQSIILGRKGTIDRVRFVSGRFWTIDTAYYLSDFEQALPLWLYYFLQTVDLGQMNEATGVPSLSREALYRLKITIPPKREQTVMSDILWTVDSLLKQRTAFLAKQQHIRTGLMQGLLSQGIDEKGNVRCEPTHLFEDTPLGRLPMEWEIKPVNRVGSVTLGRQLSPKYMKGKSQTPYLRVANVFDGWIDYTDVLEMDFTPQEREKFFLVSGDILLNEGQSLELVGRSSIYDGPDNVYCFQNTLIRFRGNQDVLPNYARAVFKWWLDIGVFQKVASQTTSVAHLGADRFAQMLFPLPSRAEQERITGVLLAHEAQLKVLQSQLTKLRSLKTALMQDLLTGRKPVTSLLTPREDMPNDRGTKREEPQA